MVLTLNQDSSDDFVAWLRERLQPDCEQYESAGAVNEELAARNLTTMDVLHVLRKSGSVVGRYEGGCYVMRGMTLDGGMLSVVVAPPSSKNRVRIVKAWGN